MDLITAAKRFATQKHVWDNKQEYQNCVPYTHHTAAVEQVLIEFGFRSDENLRVASWLHDVIEDTRGRPNEVKVRDIEEIFNEDVATLVDAVTTVEGPNRAMRNAATYPKTRNAGPRAIVLKLADRIANVRAGGRVGMYLKEHPDFRHALHLPHVVPVDTMMRKLDALLGWKP